MIPPHTVISFRIPLEGIWGLRMQQLVHYSMTFRRTPIPPSLPPYSLSYNDAVHSAFYETCIVLIATDSIWSGLS